MPVDLNCTSGATSCTNHGPSFWSRKRLTSITTQIQTGGVTKQFVVPQGATRMYIGLWDGIQFNNNSGSAAGTITRKSSVQIVN